MIQSMPEGNRGAILLKRLLIVAALVYGVQHRAEIKRGVTNFLSKNQTVQEAVGSAKWLYNEMRPASEAEKKQRMAYGEERRRRVEEYKAMGIKPDMEYVTPDDSEKWKEAVADWQELKKQFQER